MATLKLIHYKDANSQVKNVFDDIRLVRKTDKINNFWKSLANHPNTLIRTWENLKMVMAPGAIDSLTKEMIYIAVSTANSCEYCIHSHTTNAFNKGMTKDQYEELLAVISMAQQTNSLATGMQVEVDDEYKSW